MSSNANVLNFMSAVGETRVRTVPLFRPESHLFFPDSLDILPSRVAASLQSFQVRLTNQHILHFPGKFLQIRETTAKPAPNIFLKFMAVKPRDVEQDEPDFSETQLPRKESGLCQINIGLPGPCIAGHDLQ
jgi:hypothetical protein